MAKSKHSAPFGRLRYDKDTEQYGTTLDHKGNDVEVRFQATCDDDLQTLLPTAVEFWKSRVRWFKAFREYAVTELLSQLNDRLDCGQEGFKSVTAAQLRKLLPAPFSVIFTADYDDTDDIYFEMDGGDDEDTLEECYFEVFGTLKHGIVDGAVEDTD